MRSNHLASGLAFVFVSIISAAPCQKALAVITYDQFVLGTGAGPSIYWRLGESSIPGGATNLGSLGVAANGVYGSTTTLGVTGALAGSSNTAAGFSTGATTSFVRASNVNWPNSSFSVEFWMNAPVAGGGYGIVSYNASGDENGFLLFNTDTLQYTQNNNASPGPVGVDLSTGGWRHFVSTWQSTTGNLRIYNNGVLAYTQNGFEIGNIPTPGGDLMLGQEQDGTGASGSYTLDGTQALAGSLDEFALYPFVMSPADVLLHYQVGIGLLIVPEPSTGLLAALGLVAVAIRSRRRTSNSRLSRERIVTGLACVFVLTVAAAPLQATEVINPYHQYVLNTGSGPAIYWRLGESSIPGGATNSGTLGAAANGVYGSTTTLNVPGALYASTNTAAGFTTGAITSFVRKSNLTPWPGSNLSLEYWINAPSVGGTQGIVSYNAPGDENGVLMFGTNVLQYSQNGDAFTTLDVSDGTWHHIVSTWESTTGNLRIYNNGTLTYSQNGFQIGNTPTAGGDLMLGQEQDGTGVSGSYTLDPAQALTGTIDEFALYPFVMDPADALLHYQVGIGLQGLIIIPEPGTGTLMLFGLAAVAVRKRRRRRHSTVTN